MRINKYVGWQQPKTVLKYDHIRTSNIERVAAGYCV